VVGVLVAGREIEKGSGKGEMVGDRSLVWECW
jgi:hypothetical protein